MRTDTVLPYTTRCGPGADGFEVDHDLARPQSVGADHREVDLAREHDLVVAEVGPQSALGDRAPAGLQRREALEELGGAPDRLAVQHGPPPLPQSIGGGSAAVGDMAHAREPPPAPTTTPPVAPPPAPPHHRHVCHAPAPRRRRPPPP